MTLIKLSEDHYILTDDSDISIGNIVAEKLLTGEYELFTIHTLNDIDKSTQKKITHSTQPLDCACSNKDYKLDTNCAERNRCFDKVQYLPLQEVKEVLGVVDKAFERYPVIENDKDHNDRNYYRRSAYYQAIEDNKEKKYTEEDMVEAYKMGLMKLSDQRLKDYMLPKTEWEVEFVDGKLKLKS